MSKSSIVFVCTINYGKGRGSGGAGSLRKGREEGAARFPKWPGRQCATLHSDREQEAEIEIEGHGKLEL